MGEDERVHERTNIAFVVSISEERRTTEVEATGELCVLRGELGDDHRPRSVVPDRDERCLGRSLLKPGSLGVGRVEKDLAEPSWHRTSRRCRFDHDRRDVLRANELERDVPKSVKSLGDRGAPLQIEDLRVPDTAATIEDDETHTTETCPTHRKDRQTRCRNERHG